MTTYKEKIATIKAELKAGADLTRWERRYSLIFRESFRKSMSPEAHQELAQKMLNEKPKAQGPQGTSWRIQHIAYCLFRGRTLEQIEPHNKWPEDAKWCHRRAQMLVVEWKEECAEDISAWESRKATKKDEVA
jgi:hypothetical protein